MKRKLLIATCILLFLVLVFGYSWASVQFIEREYNGHKYLSVSGVMVHDPDCDHPCTRIVLGQHYYLKRGEAIVHDADCGCGK